MNEIIRDEIGSEFWSIPVADNEQSAFPQQTRWFISGTSALQYILKDIIQNNNPQSAAIPSWCCECMIEPFIREGLDVFFYSVYVDESGTLTCDYTTAPSCDITLEISYFGYQAQTIKGKPDGILVRDLTHSIFCEKYEDADYYFGSLRKWAGFWTGGYAWKKSGWVISDNIMEIDFAYVELRKGAMEEKLRYLRGEQEDKTYLASFDQAEDYLDHCCIMKGSSRDIQAALNFDIQTVCAKRKQNAKCLLKALRGYALFKSIGENDCPLFVPILLEPAQRDELRKFLIRNRVYCPVHWGVTDLHRLTEPQKYLYDHELSIVCDQRYGQEDMHRIIELITQFMK